MKTNNLPTRGSGFGAATRSGRREHNTAVPRAINNLAWPQLHIARMVKWENPEDEGVQEWGAFLRGVNSLNKATGKASKLGRMTCEYVSSDELTQMLKTKYPKDVETPAKARKLYRKVSQDINAFITTTQCLANEWDKSRYNERWPLAVDTELSMIVAEEGLDVAPTHWRDASFAVGAIRLWGKSRKDRELGFDMPHPEILEERQEIVSYLGGKDQRFDVARLGSDWQPHITFFESNPGVRAGEIILRLGDGYPPCIDLEAPHAYGPPNARNG